MGPVGPAFEDNFHEEALLYLAFPIDYDSDDFRKGGPGYQERHVTGGIPRSLQIFLARMSIISV